MPSPFLSDLLSTCQGLPIGAHWCLRFRPLAIAVLLIVASSWASEPVLAQTSLPETPANSLSAAPEIVVEGRTAKTIPPFVDKLAVSDMGRQVARWASPICIGIDGMADPFAGMVRKRIAEVAVSLKIGVLGPKCRPNITIQLTDKSDSIMRSLLKTTTRHIGGFYDDPLFSAEQESRFLKPRVVRWLSVTETRDSSGAPVVLDEKNRAPIWSTSLINKRTMEAIAGIVILIDETRLTDVTMTQLADYLTMVALARPNIAADYSSENSILALFQPEQQAPRVDGLTKRDQAFLTALYGISGALPTDRQKAAISRRMAH